MLGRIDVKVAGFTVYSKEIGFKSVDRAIKKFTDNIEKIKSVADGSAFDPEKSPKMQSPARSAPSVQNCRRAP